MPPPLLDWYPDPTERHPLRAWNPVKRKWTRYVCAGPNEPIREDKLDWYGPPPRSSAFRALLLKRRQDRRDRVVQRWIAVLGWGFIGLLIAGFVSSAVLFSLHYLGAPGNVQVWGFIGSFFLCVAYGLYTGWTED